MARKSKSNDRSKQPLIDSSHAGGPHDHAGSDKTMVGLRKIVMAIVVALIIFLALDGYLNRWGVVRTLIDWHTLELRGTDGSAWYLKSTRDFRLIRIEDPEQIFRTENLAAFDQPYREEGMYRLYFRISDSGSVRLQSLYQAISSVDSTERIQKALGDAQRAYHNLIRLLGIDTTVASDSIPLRRDEWRPPVVENDLMTVQDEDMKTAVVRFLSRSPQVLVGLGIGIAASAGADLLEGKTYCAVAREDCFRLDRLKVGARVGAWEGKSIDILWAFGKVEVPAERAPRQMPVRAEPESLKQADSSSFSVPQDSTRF
jgi:hypothetical protein